jgi:hypothetical protein
MIDETYVKSLENEVERLRSYVAKCEYREERRQADGPYHELLKLAMEEGKSDEVLERCLHQFHYRVTSRSRKMQSDMAALEEIVLQRYIPLAPAYNMPWRKTGFPNFSV